MEQVICVESEDDMAKSLEIVNQMSFNDIIEFAIIQEEEAYLFYKDLAEQVEDDHAKIILFQLAEEENEHINILEKYYGEDPSKFHVAKVEDFDYFNQLQANNILHDTSVKNLLLYAIKKEQEAYKCYMTMAKLCKKVQSKDTFIKLARLELGHKQKLEMLWFLRVGPLPYVLNS
ncbi:MAG: ferritin family protein [Bacteriovoracaceae bacterium]|nr:ferritin family protein [Bacteriovoracaceae bacterium]